MSHHSVCNSRRFINVLAPGETLTNSVGFFHRGLCSKVDPLRGSPAVRNPTKSSAIQKHLSKNSQLSSHLKQNEATGSYLSDSSHVLLNQNLNILDEIKYYASVPQSEVTMGSMYQFGKRMSQASADISEEERQQLLLKSASFILHELPIRLAKRIHQLDNLPYKMSTMPSIQKLTQLYTESFRTLVSHKKVSTPQEEAEFTQLLRGLLKKHRIVVPTMARGMIELKKQIGSHLVDECSFLQHFLEQFHLNRLGIRLLSSQHIALRESSNGSVGIIDPNCNPLQIIYDTINTVKEAALKEFDCCPEFRIFGGESLSFTFIPNYIRIIMFELLKNSTRAVLQHNTGLDIPPIDIVLADGEHDVTVKISDLGGGISRKDLLRVWFFSYTTAPEPAPALEMDPECSQLGEGLKSPSDSELFNAPLAGYGYGLPLSRLYARSFGGDVILISMDGYGTDTYVYLNKI